MADKGKQVFEFPAGWAGWNDEEKDAYLDKVLDVLGALNDDESAAAPSGPDRRSVGD